MDVSFELARQNTNAEPFTQIFNEPVDEMVGALVALVNQRVVAGQHLGFRVILSEGGKVWVVQPQIRARSSDIRQKISRKSGVQIPDGRSQHHDVSGALMVGKDEFSRLHDQTSIGAIRMRENSPWQP